MDPSLPSTQPPEPRLAASPPHPDPEQPRLGILHLMVLTTCVAIYFSIFCPFLSGMNMADSVTDLAFYLGYGVGSGVALAGLLLWPARRYRGLPFPTQPGERLLILLGMGALLEMLRNLILLRTFYGSDYDSVFLILLEIFHLLLVVVLAVLYLLAVVRTKILRWRLYFIVAASLLGFYAPALVVLSSPSSLLWPPLIYVSPHLVGLVFLLGAVLRDVVQKIRYGWPHWLGVAIALWNGAMLTVLALWLILFDPIL